MKHEALLRKDDSREIIKSSVLWLAYLTGSRLSSSDAISEPKLLARGNEATRFSSSSSSSSSSALLSRSQPVAADEW